MKYRNSYFIIIVILISILSENTFGNYTPLAPGNLAAPGSPVVTDKISFRWNNIKGAVSYTVYVSKKVGDQYVLIHKSSDYTELTDTNYILSSKLLSPAEFYRWNFKVTFADSKESFSDRLYFYLVNPDELGIAKNIYPGGGIPPGSVIGNLTPRFLWLKAKNAKSYRLIVNELTAGERIEIYNSDELFPISDTSYMIPDGKLEYGKNYSWRVISVKDNFETSSEEFFFNTQLFTKPNPPSRLSSDYNSNSPEKNVIKFQWQKVENARGYGLIIKELYNNSIEEVFNSENNGLIRDTSITISKDLLSSYKSYNVSIRSYGRAGWSEFSKPIILSSIENVQELRPLTIAPGIYNKNGIVLESIPEQFVWQKVPEAVGYGLYISEQIRNNNFKLVFSSESSGLISDTTYSISKSLLKEGIKYRWNIRANINNNWTSYSRRRYFSYGRKVISDSLILLNPGTQNLPEKEINTLNPTLKWRGPGQADSYQIIVEKKVNKNYKKVFDTDKKKVEKTSYELTEPALENNSSYRWFVIAYLPNSLHDTSSYNYFSTNISTINNSGFIAFESDEPEEIFLSFRYANVVDKNIIAYYFNGEVYLPFSEIFSYLEIQNSINYNTGIIDGFFLNESNIYLIDTKRRNITYNNQEIKIDSSDIITTDFDYFFNRRLFKELFDIDFQIFLDQLAVKTFSKFDLPIYARYQRDKNYLSLRGKEESTIPLIFNKERNVLNFGVFDYFLNYNVNKFTSPQGSYNFGIGGELLYGETTVNTRGIYSRGDLINSQADINWRYVIDDSKYLSQVAIGSLNFEGLEFTNYIGLNVTNNPVEPRKGFSTVKLFDTTAPNWTVELYLNNRLFDIVRADAAGVFSFDLPLSYGTTLVELRYYGLAGEFRTEKKLYQTPFTFYKPEEFIYNFNIGKQRISEEDIANFSAGYGITDWLTTSLGMEYIENSNSDKPVIFSSTNARLFESYLLNFTFAPRTFYGVAFNNTYFNQSTISIDYKRYFNDGLFNPANQKHDLSLSSFYPVKFYNNQLNLRATYDYSESSSSIINDYTFGVSASMSGFNPFINYSLSRVRTNRTFANQFVDFGFSYSLFAIPTGFTTFRGNLLSVSSSFDIENSEIEILALNISTNPSSIARLQLSHIYNFKVSDGSTQLQFQMYLPDFQYSAAASTEFFSHNFVGSIGYSKVIDDVDFYQRNQVGKSTVIFRLFEDRNNDGIFDKDDELLNGARIYLGTSVIEYDITGLIWARELNAHTRYNVFINEESIKNPLLVPKYKSFALYTDANPFKVIDIPFYESGEIEGDVHSFINNYKNPLAGVRVIFKNLDDNSTTTTSTFTNGSFYYYGMKPGKYEISIAQEQLDILQLRTQEEKYFVEVLPGQFAGSQTAVSIRLIPK